jgi:hypothetical protein
MGYMYEFMFQAKVDPKEAINISARSCYEYADAMLKARLK